MTTLIISVCIAIFVSFFCSISEAALYSVTNAHVHIMGKSGSKIGRILEGFKHNMDKPITGILILNTAANILGASISGVAVARIYGEPAVIYFSVLFTVVILAFGEVLPKFLGVTYNKTVVHVVAFPWSILLKIMAPVIFMVSYLMKVFHRKEETAKATEEEVAAFANVSAAEGSISPMEKQIIEHVLNLDKKKAKDIMTPRTVLEIANGTENLVNARDKALGWTHSRIPIYEGDTDNFIGVVLRHKVINEIATGRDLNRSLKSLANPLHFVPEVMKGDRLLTEFLSRKAHLFCVVNEYGMVTGVVTLEDTLETLIGSEILDETDVVADLQEMARGRWRQKRALRKF